MIKQSTCWGPETIPERNGHKPHRPKHVRMSRLYPRTLPNVSIAMPLSADKALPLLEKAIQIEPGMNGSWHAFGHKPERRTRR